MRLFSVVVLLHAHGNHGRYKSTNRTFPSVSCQLSLLGGSILLSINYSPSPGPCGTTEVMLSQNTPYWKVFLLTFHLARLGYPVPIEFALIENGCVNMPKI